MSCVSFRFELFGLAENRRGNGVVAGSIGYSAPGSHWRSDAWHLASGGTLKSIGGPYLSPSKRLRIGSGSWPALLVVASVQSDEPGGASMVLGPFAKTKSLS